MLRRTCKTAISMLLAVTMVLEMSLPVFAFEITDEYQEPANTLEEFNTSEEPGEMEISGSDEGYEEDTLELDEGYAKEIPGSDEGYEIEMSGSDEGYETDMLESDEGYETDTLESDEEYLSATGEELDMNGVSTSPISGNALDNATVRFRPAGSYSALSVKDDARGRHNVIHMYNIGHTSRFHLENVDMDNSYTIHIYTYFDKSDPAEDEDSVLDLDHKDKEGSVIHVVDDKNCVTDRNKHWQFIPQDDGTYYIRNVYSGMFWSLQHPDKINDDGNKLIQSKKPMKWEMEIIQSCDDWGTKDTERKRYDSYNFKNKKNGKTITSRNWMSELPDNTYLSDLSIPGVHDAATCGISGLSYSGRCQQFYIDDLLSIGVRFFDLRLGKGLKLEHGILTCKNKDGDDLNIDLVMSWVERFLKKNPKETVILSIKNEEDGAPVEVNKEIFNKFYDMVKNRWDLFYVGDGMPQLKDVRGKIVLISRVATGDLPAGYPHSDFKIRNGKWAIAVEKWRPGDNYETELSKLSAEDEVYELWTQDNFQIGADEKWKWITSALFGRDKKTGAEGRRAEVEARGKKAWIVNYTSCSLVLKSLSGGSPISLARDINKWLKKSDELSTNAKSFMGIVCGDFVDEQWAQRIYSINYREPVSKKRQIVSFGDDTLDNLIVNKTYGDESFTKTATNIDPLTQKQLTNIRYFSLDPGVAEVDPDTGEVTIKGVGMTPITATAEETDEYRSAMAGYVLKVAPADITVQADDKTSVYGEQLEELTWSVSKGKLYNGDSLESLGLNAHIVFGFKYKKPGKHIIELFGGYENKNYNVKRKSGIYTITKKPLPADVLDEIDQLEWSNLSSSNDDEGDNKGLMSVPQIRASYQTEGVFWEFSTDGGVEWNQGLPFVIKEENDDITGAYTIEVRLNGGECYEDSEEHTISSNIYRKKDRISGFAEEEKPIKNSEIVYDGNEHELVTAPTVPNGYQKVEYRTKSAGLDGEGISSGNWTTWSEEIPKATEAGAYAVEVRYLKEGEDPATSDPDMIDDIVVTIEKQPAPDTLQDNQKPTAVSDLSYDGEEHALINAPESIPEGYVIQYSIDDGGVWLEEGKIPKCSEAGTYFVTTRYLGDKNHRSFYGDTIRVSIAPKEPPEKLEASQRPEAVGDLVYNGSAQELVTVPSNPDGYGIEFSMDNGENWSDEIPTGTDSGVYNVKIRYVGPKNIYGYNNHEDFEGDAICYKGENGQEDYEGDEIIAEIDRTPAPDQLPAAQKPTAISGINYNGNAQPLVTAPTQLPDGYTSIEYCIDGKTGFSNAIPEATEVGNYTIRVRYGGDYNHNDFEGEELNVSITRNVTPPDPDQPVSIKDARVVLSKTAFTYNMKVQKPAIKTIKGLTLKEGTDYTAKWSNASSKKAGTYTVTITGKGGYTGVTKATYKIAKLSIKNAKVVLSANELPYNGGKACKPKINKIGGKKLVNGTDYSVKYSKSPKEIGKYTMTITGTGSCSGKTTAKFSVVKAANKATKVTSSKTVRYSKLNKNNQKFTISATVKEKAKKTFKLSSVPKKAKDYIKVTEKGVVKIKKGLKKGTYEIKVKITAAKTKHYKKTTVTKTIKITVK